MGASDAHASGPTLHATESVTHNTQLLKKGRHFTQPDVWIVDPDGDACVWKSWSQRPALERWLVDKWLAKREGRIIRALQDREGFPKFLGHPDPYTVAMSLLDAEPVQDEVKGEGLDATYFERLLAMLEYMHARGINHGDLRRKNLLRAPGDPSTPRVVDFTQCLNFGTRPKRGWKRWLFCKFERVDRVTFLKLKKWYLGENSLDAAEEAELEAVPWDLKLGRFLRKRIYRPYKHWRRGRR